MENSILNNNNLRLNVKSYREGKRDFSIQELNDIKLYLLKYKDVLEHTQFFEGEIKGNKVISCFATDFHTELFNYMSSKLSSAISIIVEIENRKIIFQKNENICSINLCELARILCDGECTNKEQNIAQGSLTEKFLKFTKTLIPCTLTR